MLTTENGETVEDLATPSVKKVILGELCSVLCAVQLITYTYLSLRGGGQTGPFHQRQDTGGCQEW